MKQFEFNLGIMNPCPYKIKVGSMKKYEDHIYKNKIINISLCHECRYFVNRKVY